MAWTFPGNLVILNFLNIHSGCVWPGFQRWKSKIFEKFDFSCIFDVWEKISVLSIFWKVSPIFRILGKNVLDFPKMFSRFSNFPDFRKKASLIFGKKFPWFTIFWKNFSDFLITENRAKIYFGFCFEIVISRNMNISTQVGRSGACYNSNSGLFRRTATRQDIRILT